MSVPLVDLLLQHAEIAEEVLAGWREVIEHSAYILAEPVADFESQFAEFAGVKHCIGVASGTDALELGLRALGIGTGDEVIVPTNSFVASGLAVVRAGARPVLVDCDATFYLIDPEQAAAKVGPKTKAIMPVHLYGQIAPMDELAEVVAGSEVVIVEDAAQAHGARWDGRSAGTFGVLAATSFYPGKNLGAYGDAGAVLTQSEEMARRLEALRNWGSREKYHHPVVGFNSRLDTLQAVVLSAKLRRLESWNSERRRAASIYADLLTNLPEVAVPQVRSGNEHVWHLYVVRVPNRDEVLKALHSSGIGAGIHYPTPIHLHGAFGDLGHQVGDFPNAEKAAGEIISLPIYPGMTVEQQEQVVESLTKALR